MKRYRRTPEELRVLQQEALARAEHGQSLMNYAKIIEGFVQKGIPEEEILPRVNVLTFHAWKARGRHVKRGEHGVKVLTWIQIGEGEEIRTIPHLATVFHISQTEPDSEPNSVPSNSTPAFAN